MIIVRNHRCFVICTFDIFFSFLTIISQAIIGFSVPFIGKALPLRLIVCVGCVKKHRIDRKCGKKTYREKLCMNDDKSKMKQDSWLYIGNVMKCKVEI